MRSSPKIHGLVTKPLKIFLGLWQQICFKETRMDQIDFDEIQEWCIEVIVHISQSIGERA